MDHYNLGVYLAEHDQIDEAIKHYRKALSIKPGYVNANNNLAKGGKPMLIEKIKFQS